jgi:hypothetical protein
MRYIPFFCVFVVIVFFGYSCSQTETSVSTLDFEKDSILQKEELIDVIVTMFLIEAAVYKAQMDGKNISEHTVLYYHNFFHNTGLSRKRILNSIQYYISKKQMEKILLIVMNNLQELELKELGEI